jgi:hypothetical protein
MKDQSTLTQDRSSVLPTRKSFLSGDENAILRVLQTTDDKDLKVLKATSSDVKYNDPLIESLSKRMFATVRDPNHPV